MPRVLVVGESWFTYTVHQKGFDAFHTAEYTEGGDVFLEALRSRGHEVTYVPAHEIATR
ncbi:glutamine amidotransferase, partial [Streptomyces neyagawaensis]